MASGDFWCRKHNVWNCMCRMPPGSITVSGGFRYSDEHFEPLPHYGLDKPSPFAFWIVDYDGGGDDSDGKT